MSYLDWTKIEQVKENSITLKNVDYLCELLEDARVDNWEQSSHLKHAFNIIQVLLNIRSEQWKTAEETVNEMKSDLQSLQYQKRELEKENRDLQRVCAPSGANRDVIEERRKIIVEQEQREEELKLVKEKFELASREKDALMIEKSDLMKKLDGLQEEYRILSDRCEFLQSRLQDKPNVRETGDTKVRKEMSSLRAQLRVQKAEIDTLEEDKQKLWEDVTRLESSLRQATMELERAADEHQQIKSALLEGDKQLAEKVVECDLLRAQVSHLSRKVDDPDSANDVIMNAVDQKIVEWKQILSGKDAEIVELYTEVKKLRDERNNLILDHEKLSVQSMVKTLKERDQQVQTLKQQLTQATQEVERTTKLLDELRSQLDKIGQGPVDHKTERIRQLQSEVQEKGAIIAEFEKKTKLVEEAMQFHISEAKELEKRLKRYEDGECGLTEAISELKTTKAQLAAKDRQLEELCRVASQAESAVNEISLENEHLRARLGISLDEPIDLDGYRRVKLAKEEEERALNVVLQKEIEKLEDERLELKRRLRAAARQLGQHAGAADVPVDSALLGDWGKDSEEAVVAANTMSVQCAPGRRHVDFNREDEAREPPGIWRSRISALDSELNRATETTESERRRADEYKIRLDHVTDANVCLEAGLKELQSQIQALCENSTKQEQGKSTDDLGIRIQYLECPTLDKLLASLDARNLSEDLETGRFLKARVDHLEGANSELRRELREVRLGAATAEICLRQAEERLRLRDAQLKALQSLTGKYVDTTDLAVHPLPTDLAPNTEVTLSQLEEHLVSVLTELEEKNRQVATMDRTVEDYRRKFAVCRHRQGLLYQDFQKERETWDDERAKLKERVERAEGRASEYAVYKTELTRLQDMIADTKRSANQPTDVEGGPTYNQKLADMSREITVLRVNEAGLVRRYIAVQEKEASSRKQLFSQGALSPSAPRPLVEAMNTMHSHISSKSFLVTLVCVVYYPNENVPTEAPVLTFFLITRSQQNISLKSEVIQLESAVTARLGYYARYKEAAAFQLESLQKQLDRSVPREEHDRLMSDYEQMASKYQELLKQGSAATLTGLALQSTQKQLETLHKDYDALKAQLALEKERRCILESSTAGIQAMKQSVSNPIGPEHVSQKVALLEMKELNERERANHAQNMLDTMKLTNQKIEERNKELEQTVAKLTKSSLELQASEEELKRELADATPKTVSSALEKKLEQMEIANMKLRHEADQLREVALISVAQTKNFEDQQTTREIEAESLRQQLLDLEAKDDQRAAMARLHRFLTQLQISESTAVRRLATAQGRAIHLENLTLKLEHRLADSEAAMSKQHHKLRQREMRLKKSLNVLRVRYAGCVPLNEQEKLALRYNEAVQDRLRLQTELEYAMEAKIHAEAVVDGEHERQALASEIRTIMTNGFPDRSAARVTLERKLIDWQSRLTNIRVSETGLRRQVDRLQNQLQHMEKVIYNQEAQLNDLELANARLVKELDCRELEWENREAELEEALGASKVAQEEIVNVATSLDAVQCVGKSERFLFQSARMPTYAQDEKRAMPDPNLPVDEQLQEAIATLKRYVLVMFDQRVENEGLKKRIVEMVRDLRAKDQELALSSRHEIPEKECNTYVSSAVGNSPTLAVLRMNIDLLQRRLAAKEESLSKAHDLLRKAHESSQEAREQHAKDMATLQAKLQEKMESTVAQLSQVVESAGPRTQVDDKANVNVAKRLQELEEALAEQNQLVVRQLERSRQLHQETEMWKLKCNQLQSQATVDKESMKTAFDKQLTELRKERDHLQSDLDEQTRKVDQLLSEVKRWKQEATRSPSVMQRQLTDRLKADLAEKERQHQTLAKALADLRRDLVTQAEEAVLASANNPVSASPNVGRVGLRKKAGRTTEPVESKIATCHVSQVSSERLNPNPGESFRSKAFISVNRTKRLNFIGEHTAVELSDRNILL
ncbi:hypothetical protein EG68_00180, partial [Paragonimus skrjabini miyazakii]